MPDDYALVPAMALASSFWSSASDSLAAAAGHYHPPVRGAVVSQHAGAGLDAGPS